MEKLITILFNSEEEAFKATQAIHQLQKDGNIDISEFYVLVKNQEGKIGIKDVKNEEIPYTASGAIVGGLIGIFGGPLGVLFGLTAGTLAGGLGDFISYSKSSKFLEKATETIKAGQTAIVARISEYWEIPLNTAIAPFQTKIVRLDVNAEIDKYIAAEINEIENEIYKVSEQLKQATADGKEELESKLQQLKKRRNEFNTNAKEKTEIQKKKLETWFDNIKSKIGSWNDKLKKDVTEELNEAKEEISEEMNEIKEDYEELKFKVNTSFNTIVAKSKDYYDQSFDYIQDQAEELDENIQKIQHKIEQLSDENKSYWKERLAELKEKREEIFYRTKEEVEAQKIRFGLWSDAVDAKLDDYESILKNKYDEIGSKISERKKKIIEKEISFHKERIAKLEKNLGN